MTVDIEKVVEVLKALVGEKKALRKVIVEVKDADVGAPIYKATVAIDGVTQRTNKDGIAILLVEPGKYILRVDCYGYELFEKEIVVPEDKDIKVIVPLKSMML